MAFGILASLVEKVFQACYKTHSRSRDAFRASLQNYYRPFYERNGIPVKSPTILSALETVLIRLAYIRKQEGNKWEWEYNDMDSYVRGYALSLWEFTRTSGSFSGET